MMPAAVTARRRRVRAVVGALSWRAGCARAPAAARSRRMWCKGLLLGHSGMLRDVPSTLSETLRSVSNYGQYPPGRRYATLRFALLCWRDGTGHSTGAPAGPAGRALPAGDPGRHLAAARPRR